ncbi:MAG: hypothetical protein KAW39_08335 [Thermoplasmata archaeon]|nr:hypothetical protein [Thermoplasmata archaeon]
MAKRSETQDKPRRRRRPGRPSILEVRKDPDLARRAAEMRFLGRSWGEIGSSLGLARSTARRLVLAYQKGIGCQSRESVRSSVPKHTDISTPEGHTQHIESSMDDDVLEKLPKTFQIFSSLLTRVREMDPKV